MNANAIRQIVATILLVLAFQTAWAVDIHSAKDQGLIGEANTGYVAAVVDAPSAEVEALISEVNQKRKAQFKGAAEKTGATVEQVRLRFHELAVERTESGHYYQDQAGNWKQK